MSSSGKYGAKTGQLPERSIRANGKERTWRVVVMAAESSESRRRPEERRAAARVDLPEFVEAARITALPVTG